MPDDNDSMTALLAKLREFEAAGALVVNLSWLVPQVERLAAGTDGAKTLIDRKVLAHLLEIAEDHCDCGPPGEGWQSSELNAIIRAAEEAQAS